MNGRTFNSEMSGTVTGGYSIGSDNNGMMSVSSTVTSGGNGSVSQQYAIALTNTTTPAQQFRMIETDDVGSTASGQHGTGVCYLATPAAFAVSTISGQSFAMGMQGENSSGTPKAYAGQFTASAGNDSGGTITSGILDGMRLDQTADNGGTLGSGTYSAPDAQGRVSLTMIPTGQTTGQTFVVYIIDANHMFLLETAGDTGLLTGDMRTQLQSSNTASNLFSGPAVLYGQAYFFNSSNSGVSGYKSDLWQTSDTYTGTYTGTITLNQSYTDNEGTYTDGADNGASTSLTFDSSNPGRASVSLGSSEWMYLYFFNNNSAFMVDFANSGYLKSGWLEAQSATFDSSAMAGSYMLGKLPPLDTTDNDVVGVLTLDGSGNITGGVSTAGEGNFSWDQSAGTMSITGETVTTTYGGFLIGSGNKGLSCVVISATKSVCLENAASDASMMTLQQ
jgi:hypothetical protein